MSLCMDQNPLRKSDPRFKERKTNNELFPVTASFSWQTRPTTLALLKKSPYLDQDLSPVSSFSPVNQSVSVLTKPPSEQQQLLGVPTHFSTFKYFFTSSQISFDLNTIFYTILLSFEARRKIGFNFRARSGQWPCVKIMAGHFLK